MRSSIKIDSEKTRSGTKICLRLNSVEEVIKTSHRQYRLRTNNMMIDPIWFDTKYSMRKQRNIRVLYVGRNEYLVSMSMESVSRKGISIFQFSQFNLNYEYQFSRVLVSNILIILLAGMEQSSRRTRRKRRNSITWWE